MNKKLILPAILSAAVLIPVFFVLTTNKASNSQLILYYSEECPHCKIVEEFIGQNNIRDKFSFIQKEVSVNQINAKELTKKAKKCGISSDSISIPFLWNNGECIIGDKDIIIFFEQKPLIHNIQPVFKN